MQDYRGQWCPFCMAYLKELAALSDEIKAAGGVVAAVTAEAQPDALAKVRRATGFNETVITDPENRLAAELKARGLLDVAISDSTVWRLRGYKHGLAQPALLVIKNDGTVLQKWAIVPSLVRPPGSWRFIKLTEAQDEHWRCHRQARAVRGVEECSEAAPRGERCR